jgi:hypothetical protein
VLRGDGERWRLERSPVSGALEEDRISDDTLRDRNRYQFKLEDNRHGKY